MRTRSLLMAAAAFLGATGASANAPRNVVIVSQLKAAPEALASDAAMLAHLQSLGYAARILEEAEPASAAAGADLIVISAAASAHKLEDKYRTARVPVLVMESYELRHMGMSGLRENVDFGTREKERYIQLVNAPHPLSAGLHAGLLNVYVKGASMNWGHPGPGASIISTFPGEPTMATEFAYEAGASMDGENLAPARRVFLFIDNAAFPNLHDEGTRLFDAAVAWAAGK